MWPFSKQEEPRVIHSGERKECWAARDTFFKCLDAHSIIDITKSDKPARKACPQELQEFEAKCIPVWTDYFKQKRVADAKRALRVQELEKAGYEPLNAPLEVRSLSEEEAKNMK